MAETYNQKFKRLPKDKQEHFRRLKKVMPGESGKAFIQKEMDKTLGITTITKAKEWVKDNPATAASTIAGLGIAISNPAISIPAFLLRTGAAATVGMSAGLVKRSAKAVGEGRS